MTDFRHLNWTHDNLCWQAELFAWVYDTMSFEVPVDIYGSRLGSDDAFELSQPNQIVSLVWKTVYKTNKQRRQNKDWTDYSSVLDATSMKRVKK